ncbi:hypothetical protein ALPR1_16983 [Algoriphagus machipongonensis]|uniref:DUF2207 domain-containing protein n=1 Tax=Algoriphagus machipongonensis TaxID=388413 RepID=A3I2Q9_9BACT|nr:hypothetical protein ALPR1_16983 [Algoriphagus machipongonensis]
MKGAFFCMLLCFGINQAYAQGFIVNTYNVEITIYEEGYFEVVEKYDLDFSVPKHGIYRDIQTQYDFQTADQNLEKREIQISEIEVPNYKFEKSSKFEQRMSGNAQIKIGDADITLEGPQHYEIKYRVDNAFIFEPDQIFFYWNVKPSNWIAPFRQINFKIHLPSGITLNENQYFIYSGTTGIDTPSNDFQTSFENGVYQGNSLEDFVSASGENVTVLLKLPPGSIQEIKPFWPFWSNFGWSIILAIGYFVFYRTWKIHGKDDHAPTVTSYYPPKGMDPAMVGYLIDDSGDNVDLISLIPYWATKGLLKVEEIDKKGWFAKDDIKLIKLNPIEDNAPDYQKTLFNGLFTKYGSHDEVLVSSLKDKFYTTMSSAKSSLKKDAQKYYDPQSKKTRNYTIFFVILSIFVLVPSFLFFWGILAAIAAFVSCVFLLIMSQFMIKKNKVGTNILSELKGFKTFIKVAEENKLKMLLKDDPNYFESTMSYALSFGLFDKWTKKFDALHIPPPTWYTSTSGRMMSMNHFSQSFSSSINSAQSTMVSSPSSSGSSSSGGGSSGGGFGGGGGGSW